MMDERCGNRGIAGWWARVSCPAREVLNTGWQERLFWLVDWGQRYTDAASCYQKGTRERFNAIAELEAEYDKYNAKYIRRQREAREHLATHHTRPATGRKG